MHFIYKINKDNISECSIKFLRKTQILDVWCAGAGPPESENRVKRAIYCGKKWRERRGFVEVFRGVNRVE